MTSTGTIPFRTARTPVETLTIRMAVPADAAALEGLAELDSARLPKSVAMLVAEVDSELRAAVPVDGGRAIADPFEPTAELVAILEQRALQLRPVPRRAARRWRPLRALHAAPAQRA